MTLWPDSFVVAKGALVIQPSGLGKKIALSMIYSGPGYRMRTRAKDSSKHYILWLTGLCLENKIALSLVAPGTPDKTS